MGVTVTNRNSASAQVDNKRFAFDMGVRFQPQSTRMLVDAGLSLSSALWDQVEPLFPSRRRETDLNLTLNVEWPQTTFYGFSPFVQITYLKRKSNQSLREINSRDMYIGFKNAF